MPTVELPNKLSALLRIAVEDAQKIEKTPGYVLDMSVWHSPANGPCAVCLAGSVMALRLRAPVADTVDPEDYVTVSVHDEDDEDNSTRNALWAIDSMRRACLDDAADELDIDITDEQRDALGDIMSVWHREYNGRAFLPDGSINLEFKQLRLEWSEYLAIADRLEGAGL